MYRQTNVAANMDSGFFVVPMTSHKGPPQLTECQVFTLWLPKLSNCRINELQLYNVSTTKVVKYMQVFVPGEDLRQAMQS